MASHHTHGLDTVIIRSANNYGPFQHPEKLIPLMILSAIEGMPLPVYGDGLQVRDWIHVDDHCAAIDLALRQARAGAIYNVSADDRRPNIDVVRAILRLVGGDDALVRHVADRPGHDRRYAVDAGRIRAELGWRPARTFDEGLAEIVAWYRAHGPWADRARGGGHRAYHDRQYAGRLDPAR
jgi:dTDP-glucose 4,6-dehydratase